LRSFTLSSVSILGKTYLSSDLRYAYAAKKMRFKRFLKYPFLLSAIFYVIQLIIANKYYLPLMLGNTFPLLTTDTGERAEYISRIIFYMGLTSYSFVFFLITTLILLFPRISCVCLKINGLKKDITLYKGIHRSEVEVLVQQINDKIKSGSFTSFPF